MRASNVFGRRGTVFVRRGTPRDLIEAARLGARLATRCFRTQGLDEEIIRRRVCARFARIFARELDDDYERETLMAAVQRASAEVLAELGK